MKYTIEFLEKIFKSCKTKIGVKKKYPAAIRAAKRLGIYKKLCAHMISGRGKWTKETASKEALLHTSRWEFQKKSKGAYLYLFNNGFLDEACAHMPENRSVLYEDKKDIAKAASSCNSRVEFKTKFQGAYVRACTEGYIDEICAHMNILCYPWTDEELYVIAKQYETRLAFRNSNNNAYNACVRRKILNKACEHMKRSCSISSYEKELFDALKALFPDVYTLKIRGKIVADKPWIGGFDIDAFDPKSNRGVEFDGKFHHSEEGLIRSHPAWPKKEIRFYHEYKDNYFLDSRGIEILHIQETDWLKDKENCIARAIDWLRGAKLCQVA